MIAEDRICYSTLSSGKTVIRKWIQPYAFYKKNNINVTFAPTMESDNCKLLNPPMPDSGEFKLELQNPTGPVLLQLSTI